MKEITYGTGIRKGGFNELIRDRIKKLDKTIMPQGNKKFLIAGVVFTVSVAAFTTIYLPFYYADQEDLKKKASQRPSSASNSVWGNMDREIKERKS